MSNKKYFLKSSNSVEADGPFSIDELKARQIDRNTEVYSSEQGEWRAAGSIQELAALWSGIEKSKEQEQDRRELPDETLPKSMESDGDADQSDVIGSSFVAHSEDDVREESHPQFDSAEGSSQPIVQEASWADESSATGKTDLRADDEDSVVDSNSNQAKVMVKKTLLVLVAIFVCLVIVVLWMVIFELVFGYTPRGFGGALPSILMFFLLRAVWRKITGSKSKKKAN